VFESFRESFPDHELSGEATRQIAFVHREDGNPSRAAEEYERVAAEAHEPELRREALLVAGGLYEEAQLSDRALGVYREYVSVFAAPIEPAVVTRFKMAEIYEARGDRAKQEAELRQIIGIDAAAGAERSDMIRVTAARSALILTEKLFRRFDEVELNQPFEANLQKKQRRMDIALEGFEKLIDYEVGEVTSAATFYMAEVFGGFSRSLLESERPADLTGSDLQDYEMVLEEEAYPFEERAIDVHEKNLELMATGVFNEWIEKSLAELAIVMPGRYAKFESSSGLIESIDTYAYRIPSSLRTPELGKTAEQIMASQATDSDDASSGDAALETIPENVETSADRTQAQGFPPAAPDPAAGDGPAATPDPGEPASADDETLDETIHDEVNHAAID
jgi:tetratricopeptide (TPR) repeat protein